MTNSFIYFLTFISLPVFAGVIGSGGTPPAIKDVLEQLSTKLPGEGGLYLDNDKLGLGVNGELHPDLTVSKFPQLPQSVRVSDIDFRTMALKKGNIDAVSLDGIQRSYRIEDGEVIDSLNLKDRRELIRESVDSQK